MKRAHISLKTKLAAALLQMLRPTPEGKYERVIPHAEAKQLTEDQILARFHFDHYPIPHAMGGADEPWNLTPLPVDDHREKTAKRDVPAIAKSKRIAKSEAEFRRRILAKTDPETKARSQRSKWPKRKIRTPL